MSEQELLSRITTDPEICHGKPCIRGLRYPVEFVLEMLSGPTTVADLLRDYPDLEEDDIRAAIAYGARASRRKRIAPLLEFTGIADDLPSELARNHDHYTHGHRDRVSC